MGDRSKIESRRAEAARQFEEAKRKGEPKPVIRCRSCRRGGKDVKVLVEMGGFVFCDSCIEVAAKIVAEQKKAGR